MQTSLFPYQPKLNKPQDTGSLKAKSECLAMPVANIFAVINQNLNRSIEQSLNKSINQQNVSEQNASHQRAGGQTQALHQRAIQVAGQYRKCEGELMDILQELDRRRAYLHFGASSLYDYCVNQLKLSEGAASNLITVSRKAMEVPALKAAVQSGVITVSKARKIAPVLNKTNQEEWLKLAQTQTARQVEKAVATVQPQLAIRETAKYKAADRIERVVGVSEELNQMLERVIDLESQRLRAPAKFEDALLAMTKLYLEKNDPLKKAERFDKKRTEQAETKNSVKKASDRAAEKTSERTKAKAVIEINAAPLRASAGQSNTKHVTGRVQRRPLHAALVHAVTMRDQRRCTHRDPKGVRCRNTRWLEVHHIQPLAKGGRDTLDNLTTLCSDHHRLAHHAQQFSD